MTNDRGFKILRRSFLAGIGATAAGSLVRPLIAQAQADAPPQRLLLIHRPCGTRMDKWWPSGGQTDWVASPMLQSFNALRNDMVILKGVDCPRVQDWLGDKHGAGMIAMVAPPPRDPGGGNLKAWPVLPGFTPEQQADTNGKFFTAVDKSIDQLLLEKIAALKGPVIPSVQLTASSESADSKQPACLRVVSYSKPDPNTQFPTALWPENRPDVAFQNIFGKGLGGLSQADVDRIQAQNKSVLDFISGDLSSLRPRLPSSQVPKIDAHLTAIRELELTLTTTPPGRICTPPTLGPLPDVPAGMSRNDAVHIKTCEEQAQIIKTMFQCDLTRVASMTYGFGNSEIKFSQVLPGMVDDVEGHHDISHNGGSNPDPAKEVIDRFYCDTTAKLLLDMKNTPDGLGPGSLLDNTLVVFWNECSDGNGHGTNDMPVLLFGGKFLKLQGGRFLQFQGRYMSDFWVQTAQAWGYTELTQYGDAQWNKGSMPGIYG